MTPEWKLFINLFPKSAFHPRFTCRGQIWRKLAVAKLPKKSSRIEAIRSPDFGLQKEQGRHDRNLLAAVWIIR